MTQPDAWRIIRRRAAAAGIAAPIGCHTFRAKADQRPATSAETGPARASYRSKIAAT
jgi:hypothetical protein